MAENENPPPDTTPDKLNMEAVDPALLRQFAHEQGIPVPEKPGDEKLPEDGGEPQAPRITLPPDPLVQQKPDSETILAQTLTDLDPSQAEVTDTDKDIYLRAVLTDTPVELTVSMYSGKWNAVVRARTVYEQQRVFDILRWEMENKHLTQGDVAMYVHRLHEYLALVMIKRVNSAIFVDLELKQGSSLEEDSKKLRELVVNKFDSTSQVRWMVIWNTLRIFETKMAKLGSMALNQDFWKPRSAAQ